jgi:hypothetical protein
MIILKIKNNAGPGNQMFMYAKAYALAKRYNQKILIVSEISGYSVRQNILQNLCLDTDIMCGFIRLDWTKNQYIFRFFRKIIFDVILRLPCFIQISQPANESRVFQKDPELRKDKLYVIDGYWECHEYFDIYREDLIWQFLPKYILSDKVQRMAKKVSEENSVVLHIRKGDFEQFGRLIDDGYYREALSKIKEKTGADKIYILSENNETAIQWCRKYGAERIFFEGVTKYLDEWYVMTMCRHHIIANSTYSWWSSYLADHPDKVVAIPTVDAYLEAEKDNDSSMYYNYYRNSDTPVINEGEVEWNH